MSKMVDTKKMQHTNKTKNKPGFIKTDRIEKYEKSMQKLQQ